MKYRLKKEDRVWTVQCRCWDMRLNRRYGSESLNTTAISAWFGQHFLFPHFQKKMFISSCNLHIHWSVLKKGKPIIMWCSKPATWTRDSLSDSSFFSLSHIVSHVNRVPHEHPWRHVRIVRQVLPQRPRPPEALEDSRHPEGTRLPWLRKRLLDLHQAKWAPQSSHWGKAIPGICSPLKQ